MKSKFLKLIIIALLIIGVNISAVFAVNTTTSKNNNISGVNSIQEENQTAQSTVTQSTNAENQNNNGLGLIAVALATGLACIGAGIAVATVGASAVGAISENPRLLGKTIIFAGLAEGIAIYGLIISIMILNKI